MREPEAEEDHGRCGDEGRADEHAIARDRIEHVAKSPQVHPHQRDAAPAAIVQSHDNKRTLSHPGESTSTARIWRNTISE